MVAGGAGDDPVTRARGRTGLNIALYVLALALGCACVFGGVLVWQHRSDQQQAQAEQERYGDVLAAARAEVEAFINIDYRDAQQSIDAVAAGATGDFQKQYDSSTKGVVKLLEREKSVMDGTVLWSGVVDVDGDTATVLAATTGTVSNVSTKNEKVARYFRLKLDLVKVGDTWKTKNLEFVS